MLIQGLGAGRLHWTFQRAALTPNYRVLAIDNRGTGLSDKPVGPYSIEQMTDDVISVLDAEGIEDAHIVGASMGGIISQMLAIKHPERVRSLTLACTACQHYQWRKDLLLEWRQIALTQGMRATTNQAARWVIGPRSFRRISPAIGWFGPLALSRPPHAFAAQIDAILSMDDSMAERLRQLAMPAMVMVGNQDILTPRGDAEDLAELIPTAELVVVSGAAHGFMIEHATTFNRLLIDFLQRCELANVVDLFGASAAG